MARPVPTQDEALSIPAVTRLLYTPVFVNPTLLGAIGGYYNSVYGVTITLAPTKNGYLNYGGVGMAWSWLNPNLFERSSELIFQSYYRPVCLPVHSFNLP